MLPRNYYAISTDKINTTRNPWNLVFQISVFYVMLNRNIQYSWDTSDRSYLYTPPNHPETNHGEPIWLFPNFLPDIFVLRFFEIHKKNFCKRFEERERHIPKMFETHGMLNKRSGSYSSLQSGNRRAILKAWGTCSSSSDSRLKQEEVQGLLSTDSSSNPEEVRRFIGSDEKRECPSPARSHFANDFSSRSGSSTASLTIQIETAGFKVPDSMEASQRYDILNWLIQTNSEQLWTISQ